MIWFYWVVLDVLKHSSISSRDGHLRLLHQGKELFPANWFWKKVSPVQRKSSRAYLCGSLLLLIAISRSSTFTRPSLFLSNCSKNCLLAANYYLRNETCPLIMRKCNEMMRTSKKMLLQPLVLTKTTMIQLKINILKFDSLASNKIFKFSSFKQNLLMEDILIEGQSTSSSWSTDKVAEMINKNVLEHQV